MRADAWAATQAQESGSRTLTAERFARLPFFRRLPEETIAVASIASPLAAADALMLYSVLNTATRLGECIRERSFAALGADITDPGRWSRIWADAEAPLTVALLRLDPPVAAVGWRVTDPSSLLGAVHLLHAGGTSSHVDVIGGATLISGADRSGPVFGIAGDEAWVVLAPQVDAGDAFVSAVELAGRSERKMVDEPRVSAALASLSGSFDVFALVNVPALVQTTLQSQHESERTKRLRSDERSARAARDFALANKLMDERLRAITAAELVAGADTSRRQMLRAVVAPLDFAVVGLELDDAALRVHAHVDVAQGSGLMRLLKTDEPAGTRMNPADGANLSVELDLMALERWIRWVFIAGGRGDYARVEADLRAHGIALRHELVGASAGSLRLTLNAGEAGVPEVFGHWSVRDGARLMGAIERLAEGVPWARSVAPGLFEARLDSLPPLWLVVDEDATFASAPALDRVTARRAHLVASPDTLPRDEAPALSLSLDFATSAAALECELSSRVGAVVDRLASAMAYLALEVTPEDRGVRVYVELRADATGLGPFVGEIAVSLGRNGLDLSDLCVHD